VHPHIKKAKNGCHGNVSYNLDIGYDFIGYLDPETPALETSSVSLTIIQLKL